MAELNADACLCIVDYEMQDSLTRLCELSIQLYPLTDFTSLTFMAFELNLINLEDLKTLKEWHTDPKAWSAKF